MTRTTANRQSGSIRREFAWNLGLFQASVVVDAFRVFNYLFAVTIEAAVLLRTLEHFVVVGGGRCHAPNFLYMSLPTRLVPSLLYKRRNIEIDSGGPFRSHHLPPLFLLGSGSFVLISISSLFLMSCRAPFPSFTTVILSACDSFKYSNYHNPTQREDGVLQCQPHFRRELDFMVRSRI